MGGIGILLLIFGGAYFLSKRKASAEVTPIGGEISPPPSTAITGVSTGGTPGSAGYSWNEELQGWWRSWEGELSLVRPPGWEQYIPSTVADAFKDLRIEVGANTYNPYENVKTEADLRLANMEAQAYVEEAEQRSRGLTVSERATESAQAALDMVAEARRTGDYSALLGSYWAYGYSDYLPKEKVVEDIERAAEGAVRHGVASSLVNEAMEKGADNVKVSKETLDKAGANLITDSKGNVYYQSGYSYIKVGGTDTPTTTKKTSTTSSSKSSSSTKSSSSGLSSYGQSIVSAWSGAKW